MRLFLLIFVPTVIAFFVYNLIQKNRKDVPVYYKNRLYKNYNARTIPPFGIYVNKKNKNNAELLNHEKIHWKQYQDKGLINYYSEYLNEINNFGYDNSPMEISARINESNYCKTNYTDCVRTGKSKTIFNPHFRT